MTEEMSVANPYRAENTLKRVDELLQKVNNVQGNSVQRQTDCNPRSPP